MKKDEIQKIKDLFKTNDWEALQQGLELLDSLSPSFEDLIAIFALDTFVLCQIEHDTLVNQLVLIEKLLVFFKDTPDKLELAYRVVCWMAVFFLKNHDTDPYFTKGISSFSFRNIDLRNVELKDCNLENISIQYAYYNEHTSWPEDFDFIHSGALGPGAQLKNKNLSNNVCRNMILTDADLSHVYASGVYFCKARLENSNLTGAMLCNADFHEANFSNCNLSKADLRGCNLQGAQLLGVNLNKARHDQGTIWPDGFRCEEHVLLGERGDYRGLDFSHEDLSHLVLSQGDFQYATLVGANLQHTCLGH